MYRDCMAKGAGVLFKIEIWIIEPQFYILQTGDGMHGRSSEEAGTRVTEQFPNDEFCQIERLAFYSHVL